MALQELRPAHTCLPPLRCGRHMMAAQDVPHRDRVEMMPQVRQGALDASIAPADMFFDHLDHKLFEAFVQTVGIYPVGSLVRLQSERLAVVTEASEVSLLAPRIKVFYAIKPQQRIPPYIIDLAAPHCEERIVTYENPADWPFDDLVTLWRGSLPNEQPALA